MVREVGTEEMKANMQAAQALKDSVKLGMGDPLSLRIADSLLELSGNVEVEIKCAQQLYSALQQREEQACKALDLSQKAANYAGNISKTVSDVDKYAMDAIKKGAKTAVIEAVPEEINSLVDDAQRKIADAAVLASAEISAAATDASKTIKHVEDATEQLRKCAQQDALFSHLPLVVRVVLVLIMVAFVASCATVGWRMLPLVTGEVKITQEETFRSDLDATQLELTKTRNELNTYKEAFPEGLSEQRKHDLNAANQSAQDAYDNKS